MNTGPRKQQRTVSVKAAKQRNNSSLSTNPMNVATTTETFVQTPKAKLEELLSKKILKPQELEHFVKHYISGYEKANNTTLSFDETKALINQANAHYIALFNTELNQLPNKDALAALADLLEDFVSSFPSGEKSLIHAQDEQVFADFSKSLLQKLSNLEYLNDSETYTLRTKPKSNEDKTRFGCAETAMLQSLAKLPISLKRALPKPSVNALGKEPKTYGQIINNYILRASQYIVRQKKHASTTVTMTAAALSHFDVDSFITQTKQSGHLGKTLITNVPVETFVSTCKKFAQSNDLSAKHLIQLMHAIILFSPNDARTLYLDNELAAQWLDKIKGITLNTKEKSDRALANQLFFIKNIYPKAFPNALDNKIKPFLALFAEDAHDSGFERVIKRELTQAATELKRTYPGLIDPRLITSGNPISEALGLESDMNYMDGDLKVCIQVDGEKYHRYPGSKTETKRTTLRDLIFKSDGWNLIKFTDNDHGKAVASNYLYQSVVVPTFEMKTTQNIAKVKQMHELLSSDRERLSAYDDNAISLQVSDLLAQLSSLEKSSPAFTKLKSKVQSLADKLLNTKASTKANLEDLSKMLLELDSFDASSLTMVSAHLNKLELDIETLSAKQKISNSKLIEVNAALVEKQSEMQEAVLTKISDKEIELKAVKEKLTSAISTAKQWKEKSDEYDPSKRKEGEPNRQELKELVESSTRTKDALLNSESTLELDIKKLNQEKGKFEQIILKKETEKHTLQQENNQSSKLLAKAMDEKLSLEKAIKAGVPGTTLLRNANDLHQSIKDMLSLPSEGQVQLQQYAQELQQLTATIQRAKTEATTKVAPKTTNAFKIDAKEYKPGTVYTPQPQQLFVPTYNQMHTGGFYVAYPGNYMPSSYSDGYDDGYNDGYAYDEYDGYGGYQPPVQSSYPVFTPHAQYTRGQQQPYIQNANSGQQQKSSYSNGQRYNPYK